MTVESVLKNSDKSLTTIAELKRKLPKQVNHRMLKVILEYLEESNKIAVSMKGFTWVHNQNGNILKQLRREFAYPGKDREN